MLLLLQQLNGSQRFSVHEQARRTSSTDDGRAQQIQPNHDRESAGNSHINNGQPRLLPPPPHHQNHPDLHRQPSRGSSTFGSGGSQGAGVSAPASNNANETLTYGKWPWPQYRKMAFVLDTEKMVVSNKVYKMYLTVKFRTSKLLTRAWVGYRQKCVEPCRCRLSPG